MKKIIYGVAMAALLVSMTACGGKNAEKAEDTELANSEENKEPKTITLKVVDGTFADGELADYIELVPGEYTMTCTSQKGELELKAKATAQTDMEISGSSKFGVYDAAGNEIGTMYLWSSDIDEGLNAGDTDTEYVISMHYYADSELPMDEFMKKAKEVKGLKAENYSRSSSSSSSSSSASSDSGSTLVSSSDLATFISKGKSGNIDKMIEALEWQNKIEADLKPQVRALNEDAIKAKIAVDKAINEIGEKYDSYSLMGALDYMTDEMSNSQLNKYNSACAKSVTFFNANDDTSEYDNLYRKLRYGAPF